MAAPACLCAGSVQYLAACCMHGLLYSLAIGKLIGKLMHYRFFRILLHAVDDGIGASMIQAVQPWVSRIILPQASQVDSSL